MSFHCIPFSLKLLPCKAQSKILRDLKLNFPNLTNTVKFVEAFLGGYAFRTCDVWVLSLGGYVRRT